uniref:Mos1 transposase HTH domain-containing protein n=1 Tax=Acrobeloides nanus TaxID=290746 RepID=A0A914EHZ2_9BILA
EIGKNRGVIRELLKYEFELGHSEKEALDNINRAKGHGKVDRTTVWRWFSKFRNNQMKITDKKRAGRPREVDRVTVVNAVETHPSMTTRIWEPLDHAPYSPDMAPSDFYLFRSLQHWLRERKFRTIEEMRESLTEFFDSKDRDWYHRGIHRLEEQWQKVIENNGEYFDY